MRTDLSLIRQGYLTHIQQLIILWQPTWSSMPDSPNKLVQFLNELKRRRVIHVTIVYSTAAFIIIELVNNVTEPLNLPEWTPTFVIVVLLVGFPMALIFSWIFDITPDGQWFLMINEGENESTATQIHIVLNWFEELKRLAPTEDGLR